MRKPASFKEVTALDIVPEDVIEQLNSLNQKSVASKANDDDKVSNPSKKGTSPSPKPGEDNDEDNNSEESEEHGAEAHSLELTLANFDLMIHNRGAFTT